jgi:hypothetical protein
MPSCKSAPSSLKLLAYRAALLLFAPVLAACADRNGDFGFELQGIQTRVSGQQLRVTLDQEVKLSPDAREALENGVPIYIEIQADLEAAGGHSVSTQQFEIRYMPLSDHYQLSSDQPAHSRTFPRLRHALAELSELELVLPLANVPAGEYRLRARSRLEKQKLPAPMRLPAWFSPNWQHDSGWQSWLITIPDVT